MNLSIPATRCLALGQLFARQNAPTILTGAGIAGFIATTALTIRATFKAAEVIPDIQESIAKVKIRSVDLELSEKEAAKNLGKEYGKHVVTFTKIYGPPLILGSLSITSVLAGHNIMLKRQASLVAAYTAVDQAYKAYRKRVAEKIGKDEELDLYRGFRTVTSCDEEGQPCEIIDLSDVQPSPYSRWFDESSRYWTKTPEYNLMYLRGQQMAANDRLQSRGYLFLNEVFEALGLEWSQMGQVVGWKKDANLNGTGDGFVDFGLYDIYDENKRAFVNGLEGTTLLDFNVDGVIGI